MYKEKPWTLSKKSLKISEYIEENKKDLAVSCSRVKQFFELHKEKTFTTNQIAKSLNLSIGTVSSIMNRLITIGDINVVTMQRPHWAPVFQHADLAPCKIPFRYTKEDPISIIMLIFRTCKDTVFTKKSLSEKIDCSQSMLQRSLQILLTNGEIKLVGSTDNGHAKYQYKEGNKEGIPIYIEKDLNYSSLSEYLIENNLKKHEDLFKKELKGKARLFYTSLGIRKKYSIDEMNKISKKINKKNIISNLFTK